MFCSRLKIVDKCDCGVVYCRLTGQIYNPAYPLVKSFSHFFQILWNFVAIFVYFCTTNQILFQLIWTMALVTRIIAALPLYAMPSRCGVKHGICTRAAWSFSFLKLFARHLAQVTIDSSDKFCWDAGLKVALVPNPG